MHAPEPGGAARPCLRRSRPAGPDLRRRMTRVSAIAVGAVSAFGRGRAAFALEEPGEPARTVIARDARLAEAGLTRPQLARAGYDPADAAHGSEDRATMLLAFALEQVTGELDRLVPGWRSLRIAIAAGTSSGGMLSAE